MAEYIRARWPLRITPRELHGALQAFGYVTGSYAANRQLIYRNLKKMHQEMSRK